MATIIQKKFYFTRHGQTDWNVKKLCQGQTDIELNETGRLEAKRLGLFLKDFPLLGIYTSPLKRALETAQLIQLALPDCTLHLLDELKERSWGMLEGRPRQEMCEFEEQEKTDPNIFLNTGAEPIEEIKSRLIRGINIALTAYECPLIVSHGRTFTVLCELLGVPPLDQLSNATLVELTPVLSTWTLEVREMPALEPSQA